MNKLIGSILWLISSILILGEYVTKSLFILSMSNMGTVGNISLVHNLELVLMSIIFFVFGIYFFLKKEK
ncbi:hypothetical protein [Candidatus Galacturonibacter soehngenii]|uniref:Uncharacterized protein n=1 Tax=Candidatus Galacturonatibacter soehngenii TaxID=2307010 RepID=A0A7V7UCJ1_9FIRM|nr:hypothetical protein [Candidatus Galacturonibacter soehngenii]KAB1439537.1 hypothetical protein F7O84_03855 [Candidatus Galacturonibacter soehngenii]